jgi:hypothetical protein
LELNKACREARLRKKCSHYNEVGSIVKDIERENNQKNKIEEDKDSDKLIEMRMKIHEKPLLSWDPLSIEEIKDGCNYCPYY